MKKDISSIVIVILVICTVVAAGAFLVVQLLDIVSKPDSQAADNPLFETKRTTEKPARTPEVKKLKTDSYTSWWSTHDEYNEGDFNFTISGNDNGTMYLMDATTLEMEKKDFTYTYLSSTVTFYFDDGTNIKYTAAKNAIGNLELTEKLHTSLFHNLYRYSEYMQSSFSANKFTAFGCWYLYEPDTDYLESISLWHNNKGLYYNSEIDEISEFSYDYSDYTLTLHFDDHTKQYIINHLGNVLELVDMDDYSESFMLRANETIMAGKYDLEQSNDDRIKNMTINLGYHGTLGINYEDKNNTFIGTEDSWYINRADGYLGMYDDADDGTYSFNFHYCITQNGLYIIRTDYSEPFYLEKVE